MTATDPATRTYEERAMAYGLTPVELQMIRDAGLVLIDAEQFNSLGESLGEAHTKLEKLRTWQRRAAPYLQSGLRLTEAILRSKDSQVGNEMLEKEADKMYALLTEVDS